MKATALFYASLPHKIIRGMSGGQYMSQCDEFNALIGWGPTAAAADADLAERKLKLCQQLEAQNVTIPAPRHQDETIYQRVWDAAFTSLLAALDAEGVIVTGDATVNVLTLAKTISEKIQTAGNSTIDATPENEAALRCAIEVLDGEGGGYSADEKYRAKCQIMTLLGQEIAATQTASAQAPKIKAAKKATGKKSA